MFPIALLLCVLLLGCSPRPPSWPPSVGELAEIAGWYVDVERYQSSAHGSLACDRCHADLTTGDPLAPHPDPAKLTLEATALYDYQICESCHPQEYAAYLKGVHADAMASPESVE